MKKSILFVVPYPDDTAPSQRLKFEQYYQKFEAHGFDITLAPFVKRNFWKIIYKRGYYFTKVSYTILSYLNRYKLLFTSKRYDVIYIHLWGTPFGFPIYEWLLCKLSKRVVYDIDDLIYLGKTSDSNKVVGFLKSSLKVNFLLKHASHVLVSTDKLLNYAKQFTANVSVIPATIDVKKYTFTKTGNLNKVVIGWSGSHTTSKYLHLLDDVLKKISDSHAIKIMVMGDPDFKIDGLSVELIKWSSESEISNLQQFDIGLHPVPDEEWVYGKSGGKLVQYMAAGLPIVASAVGPNFKAIQDGYNGFLVNNDDEWITQLELLITDVKLRKKMAANSKLTAVKYYSTEINLEKYLKAIL